jgi:TolA-binding protein
LYKHFYILFVFVLVFSSCRTNKNAVPNKLYHYTTVKFNGYFHGNEALKEAYNNIQKNHVDDYSEILPVFKTGTSEIVNAQNSLLDRAIKKSAKMQDKHSMVFKINKEEVEVNKMIDDCSLLMGRAQFYKKDYPAAIQTFKYHLKTYPKNKTYFKAVLYLLRCYYYDKNIVDFEAKKTLIEEDPEFPKSLQSLYNQIRAEFYLAEKNYTKALEHIEIALETEKSKRTKQRLIFISAQIYQIKGDENKAAQLFDIVAKKSLDFNLGFQAKLNYALTFQKTSKSKSLDLLAKMIEDKKNKEFLDQIYYVKAKIHRQNLEEEKAIENFKLSAWKSVNNPKQKALSYLELGNYYFELKNYKNAYTYLDSSLKTLPTTYPNYDDIVLKTNSLTELMEGLNSINLQDSLIRLSKMSEIERYQVIEKQIEQMKKLENDKIAQEKLKQEIALQQANNAVIPNAFSSTGSTWIFDNVETLPKAYNDFVKIWGTRKLEDNWRRSKKTATLNFDVATENSSNPSSEIPSNEKYNVEYYLSKIPKNPQEIDEVKSILKKSIYNVAEIYKFKLKDIPESNKYFNRYISEFNEGEEIAVAKYQLFRSYIEEKDFIQSDKIKMDILKNHNDTKYADLVKNPNKFEQEEGLQNKMNDLYAKVLLLYKQNNFDAVVENCNQIIAENPDNTFIPEFALLKTFAVGKLKGPKVFEEEILLLQTQYDDSSISGKVYAIVKRIQSNKDAEMELLAKQEAKQKEFISEDNLTQMYAIISSTNGIDLDKIQQEIQFFNQQYFPQIKLNIQQTKYSDSEKIIEIKFFNTKDEVKNYHTLITQKVLSKYNTLGNRYFPITENNLKTLVKFKEVEKYYAFYKQNY